MMTTDNYYLEIDGYEVIENLALFEVSNIPIVPLIFKFSSIDPYYTRYKSSVMLSLPNGETITGAVSTFTATL